MSVSTMRELRGFKTHETLEEEARIRRLREILSREPDLENWQIAERLGLTELQANRLKHSLTRRKTR